MTERGGKEKGEEPKEEKKEGKDQRGVTDGEETVGEGEDVPAVDW